MQTYQKLGFEKKESQSIVHALNQLLANYQLYYHKLRGFHWNVEGRDFFELHEKFEEDYQAAHENIDRIAERIRIFGQKPIYRLAEYLELSKIKEAKSGLAPEDMVRQIVDDMETLLGEMLGVVQAAEETGDTASIHLIMNMMQALEKRHWMFSAWLKKVPVSTPQHN
ncbi:DNA starvation/stationary phase protection protein [Saprospira sp. CCB-QB6]|uniref:Dps family protein n=1 Tax=Saprospira sp. CCB-QB6 TaxID=3023936 RepID=UPI0023494254|nr:DNA starvation/stationary phase protection protein [Saprospira sp. CCB-QB6]WCL80648.1 DNA starvation/stationary phase protection protein [Saprospira sp. CCB-QB6]